MCAAKVELTGVLCKLDYIDNALQRWVSGGECKMTVVGDADEEDVEKGGGQAIENVRTEQWLSHTNLEQEYPDSLITTLTT